MMRRLSARRGQSMGEYAILFAIVLGAAIAMQQYVKSRLQGATAGTADGYMNAAAGLGGYGTFEPNRVTTSDSTTGLTMQSAKAGTVGITSKSDTVQTK